MFVNITLNWKPKKKISASINYCTIKMIIRTLFYLSLVRNQEKVWLSELEYHCCHQKAKVYRIVEKQNTEHGKNRYRTEFEG